MGETSKKQCTPAKECGQSGPQQNGQGDNQQTKRIVWIGCGAVALAVCLWAAMSSEPESRGIAEITRPPEGFEAPIDQVEEKAEHSSTPVSVPLQEPIEEKHEEPPLSNQESELQVLLKEQQQLITELTLQLEESEHGQGEQANPTEESASPEAPAPIEESPPKPETEPKVQRLHTVQKGETLSEIARHYYGASNHWKQIYEANQTTLSDKNRLRVGTVLVIPE